MLVFNRRTQRTPSRKMPRNASRTTARKAYATAVASERRTARQKINSAAGSWSRPKITKAKRGNTGSLKIAGQRAQSNVRQAYRNNVATSSWDKTRNAFKVK